jgi:FtsH-binding integral membrane protein
VSFAREGLVFIAIAALLAAGTYAVALHRRSWPLWLLAFALTILVLWIAYFFRDPARAGPGGQDVGIATVRSSIGGRDVVPTRSASLQAQLGGTMVAGSMNLAIVGAS